MSNTHIKGVFIDHKHAHVLGQQFARMSYKDRKTKDKITQTKHETEAGNSYKELNYF